MINIVYNLVVYNFSCAQYKLWSGYHFADWYRGVWQSLSSTRVTAGGRCVTEDVYRLLDDDRAVSIGAQ